MIFCGDVVFPVGFNDKILTGCDDVFLEKEKIINLESLIILGKSKRLAKGIALSSSGDVFNFFEKLNVVAVSQANNHITDFEESIDDQKRLLSKYGIDAFGAGDDLTSASMCFSYNVNKTEFVVLSFGKDMIGCQYATESRKGVNPMEYKHIFNAVKDMQMKNSQAKIILIFHNNYEFELYPQPADRKMFFDLVDVGVDMIFCHHPHVVGGCEIYKNGAIFYSLGNFYLPEMNYHGYNLSYSDAASKGLCVEYTGEVADIQLYWTYKDKKNCLSVLEKELLSKSKKINDLTPFAGMEYEEYIEWFKVNRKKKKLLPVYRDYNNDFESSLNGALVKYRQLIIDCLVRIGVK